jgi:hypothetical protein
VVATDIRVGEALSRLSSLRESVPYIAASERLAVLDGGTSRHCGSKLFRVSIMDSFFLVHSRHARCFVLFRADRFGIGQRHNGVLSVRRRLTLTAGFWRASSFQAKSFEKWCVCTWRVVTVTSSSTTTMALLNDFSFFHSTSCHRHHEWRQYPLKTSTKRSISFYDRHPSCR